jgi:hypothetical protein
MVNFADADHGAGVLTNETSAFGGFSRQHEMSTSGR